MNTTQAKKETSIIIGIDNGKDDIEKSLDELALLAKTAGITVDARLTQRRDAPNNATYIGKGKIDELKDLIYLHNPNIVIFNEELSAAQLRNLSDKLDDILVIDRTLLILDIFATSAKSSEGKIQVELAQLKYRLSHLSGMGKMLSRLGGGIGTRGPGETKLETDRRHIRGRINSLNAELKNISKTYNNMRKQRERSGVFLVALVGYTNAGKSSIMNLLANENLLAQDKLFATLDTTTRKMTLSSGKDILISDTVGFIEKLPYHLIEAFKTTLEELKYADILLHITDAADPARENHVSTVMQILNEIGCKDKPMILIYNKVDKEVEYPLLNHADAMHTLEFSAKTGYGKDKLLHTIDEIIKDQKHHIHVIIPYSEQAIINFIHQKADILSQNHDEDGTHFELMVDDEGKNKLAKYVASNLRI